MSARLPALKPTPTDKDGKPKIHINIGEVGTFARVGMLQPSHAFNLDVATRRSAREIARDRLHVTGFPRVISEEADEEMIESARRSCSARGYSTRHNNDVSWKGGGGGTSGRSGGTSTAAESGSAAADAKSAELAKELEQVGGGGGFNLSLLSSSRYYHGAASTMSGLSEANKKQTRNQARQFIQQKTQLPYGRESFPGVSDTADSLYGSDFCRRYKINDKSRYSSSIEVLGDTNRKLQPRADGTGTDGGEDKFAYLRQTPRGRATMEDVMTHRPKREQAAIAGGYF